MTIKKTLAALGAVLFTITSMAQNDTKINSKISKLVESYSDQAWDLYKTLHESPELSLLEKETSARMAALLRESGLEVTERFGGYGVVGILRNGDGPVIMIRTDMDALPIKEKTGLEFASARVMEDASGNEMPVMHACGHDMHMTVWSSVVKTMASLKDEWHGTLMAIAQPAEEVVKGAVGMIDNGLFEKFPVPDYAICFHVSPELPAGSIGYYPGPITAGVNSAEITMYGRGGHGAMPHKTIDPIVLSARTILALQTIVSREINPVWPAVVTVGSIHGGTKDNIIPGEVKMQLTLRFFTDKTYKAIQDALARIPAGIAASAGVPDDLMPLVELGDHYTPPVANDPDLVLRSADSFASILGSDAVVKVEPATVAEDFGRFGRTPEKVPVALFWLGAADPVKLKEAEETGKSLPALHNPAFCPDFRPTFEGGVKAMSKTLIDLFNGNQEKKITESFKL